MDTPLISIIIATYNSAMTLSAALQSVVDQKFQDWECIIVDGASTDNTIEIAKDFEKKDPRIRHLSEPDNGIYDAFNKGWKMAKGKWIHYLGSDDKLTKESFCEMMSSDNAGYSVIAGAVYVEKVDGSLKLLKSEGWEGCHQGKLTLKSEIKRFNGFDEQYRIVADYDLYRRFCKAGLKIKNYDGIVAYFASTGISLSFKSVFRKYSELLRIDKNNGQSKIIYRTIRLLKVVLSIFYRNILKFVKK